MVDGRTAAIAQLDIGAGAFLQHVGEILARHDGRRVALHSGGYGLCRIGGVIGLILMVHGRGIAAQVGDVGGTAMRLCGQRDNLAQPLLRQITHACVKGPYRSL